MWDSVVTSGPPGLGCSGALWGAVMLLGDGTGGAAVGAHACFAWGCVGGNGKCGDSMDSMGAVGTSGAPDHGVHWSSMGPGGPLDGGRGGEEWGTHACFAWISEGGRGSGMGLSADLRTSQFGVQWGSVGCCEVI